MHVSAFRPRRLRGVLALAFAGLVAALMVGLGASPAAATDGTSGTLDTSATSVLTQGGQPEGGDECEGDRCKRYNWCPPQGAETTPKALTADAPLVMRTRTGGDEPPCIKKPHVQYKCCEVDDKGTHNAVRVVNHNDGKLLIRVSIGTAKPITKWVDGHSTAVFVFRGIANGEHELRAAVWAGGGKWCEFKQKTIVVKCVEPTPTATATPEPTPTATAPTEEPTPRPSTTPVGNVGQLPKTGSTPFVIAMVGVLLIVGGGVLLLVRRRRMPTVVAE